MRTLRQFDLPRFRLEQLWLDERGISLVMAMGIMLALSITGTSVVAFSASNSRTAEYSADNVGATHIAEAGEAYARSILWNASDPKDANAVGSGSVSIEGGTATYSGSYDSGTQTWTLTGTSSVPNPTGGDPITRTVTSQVKVNPNVSSPEIWAYNYADAQSGCGVHISSKANISAPLYVRGNMCMSGTSSITGSPLHIGGTLDLGSQASVGTSSTPIGLANIVGGCVGGSPDPHPCTSSDNVYADSYTQDPLTLTMPPLDLPGMYQIASPGPMNSCTVGSMPGGFDNDTTQNRSRATFELTPSTAYDCRTDDGRITWTPGNPGTLVVDGTIFFDGDIDVTNSAFAVYQGAATIYASGKVDIGSKAKLCGIASCDENWDTSVNSLVLVAGSSTDTNGFKLGSNTVYQGGAYVVTRYHTASSAENWGPVIADTMHMAAKGGQTIPLNYVPPGAPGAELPPSLENVANSYSVS